MAAMAVVVDVGVQRSHVEQSQGVEKPGSSSALDFFWRIFARVADYVTRIRRFFVFTVAKEGNLEVKEERGILKNEIQVVEGVLVEASGASAAELSKIVVSPKETITQGPLGDDLKVLELCHEDCRSQCSQIKVGEHWGFSDALHNPTPSAENHEARASQHAPATEQSTSDSFQDGPNSVSCDSQVVELHHEDCGNKSTTQIKMDKDLEACDAYKPAPSAEDHGESTIEHALVTEQSTSDDLLQQGPISVTCEPAKAFPLELNDGHCKANPDPKCHTQEENVPQAEELTDEHCIADAHQNGHIQDQNASQEKLEDVVISEKCIILQALSPLCVTSNSGINESLKNGSLESLNTSSPALSKQFSIQHLNAIIGEQLTKYLQVLERSVVLGKAEHAIWNHKTTHRRAIILATLVAIAVWARNLKHLHESMPRIKGSAINVHIRSRL